MCVDIYIYVYILIYRVASKHILLMRIHYIRLCYKSKGHCRKKHSHKHL